MSISLDWDNGEKTTLRLTLADGWEWEDLHVINPVAVSLMHSVDHTVHILVDHTRTNHLAHGGLTHAVDLMGVLPPNLGCVVIVTHILALRRALRTVALLTGYGIGRKLFAAATFDDGYRMIADYESRES